MRLCDDLPVQQEGATLFSAPLRRIRLRSFVARAVRILCETEEQYGAVKKHTRGAAISQAGHSCGNSDSAVGRITVRSAIIAKIFVNWHRCSPIKIISADHKSSPRNARRRPAALPQSDEQETLKVKLTLTQREAEVLLWIARGKSNRDVAEILMLSLRTVNKPLEQIYAKLGVENRASAAALAMRPFGDR